MREHTWLSRTCCSYSSMKVVHGVTASRTQDLQKVAGLGWAGVGKEESVAGGESWVLLSV